MNNKDKVINTAAKYIGGTRYNGKVYDIMGIYNTIKPLPRRYAIKKHDDYCACFVSAIFQKIGEIGLIKGGEVSCPKLLNKFKDTERPKQPKAGDLIFFDWSRTRRYPRHVGLVSKVEGGKVYTIEGNTTGYINGVASNGIFSKVYNINDTRILGYARPAYYEYRPTKQTEKVAERAKVVLDVLYGKYGNGATRVMLLKKHGYNPAEIQAHLNYILIKKNIRTVAYDCINGYYGNGYVRVQLLKLTGYDYKKVQDMIAYLLRGA